ncbi:MAG: hypothetical protein JNJ77_09615 [Planctomycetia bacterium]|nr:hypothetical protein [Planctomycetia bacterium]
MARKSSRSSADQPQSNTVLIVFLVFSILLNLALGVFLYLAQDKIEQANKTVNDAKNTQTGMENQRKVATDYAMPLLRALIGDTTVTADELARLKQEALTTEFAKLPQEATSWYGGKVWRELVGGGQNNNGLIGPFSDTTGKPAISLIDKVRQLQTQLNSATEKLKTTEANLAKVNGEFNTYKGQWNDIIFAQRLKENQDAMQKDTENKLKLKDEVIAESNRKAQDTVNDMTKLTDDLKKNFDAQLVQNKQTFDTELKKESDNYREQIAKFEQDKITSLNVPKARIVEYEPGTDLALIDLGSAVKLPLGLTFSVHGRDPNDTSGAASPRKKAEVVVIRVLGEQLAQVRITRMARPDTDRIPLPSPDLSQDEERRYWDKYFTSNPRDFIRSNKPLYKGDYLFNVVWDPTKRTRVALIGEFDLDGDGTDDIQSLISLLNAQGADVVTYLDKTNGYKPKRKLDFNTDLVVIGDIPLIKAQGGDKGLVVNRSNNLVREGIAVQKDAIEKGIRIVQLPKFLSEMGINPPQALLHKTASLPTEVKQPAQNNAPPADNAPPVDNKPGQ